MSANPKPIRQVTLIQVFALIVGAVIGSGIFINVPIVARIAESPLLAVFIWMLGGLLWLPQILILAEMGTAYPNQGGPYYFLHKAGSPLLAFLYTWTAFLTSDTPTLTIIGLLAADALTFFFPEFFGDPFHARQFASVLIILFAIIQYRSVKTGSNVQIILTVSKLLPLAAVVLIGMFFLGDGNIFFENPFKDSESGTGSFMLITAGVAATVWAYAGFINILYSAGEVKNPQKVLPKALIGSLLFVMFAYILISLCTSAIVPFSDLIAVPEGKFINPFAYLDSFADYAGGIFAVAVFVSMLGVLNSVMLTQPRLEYAMARDGLFFKAFGHLHPKHLTPDYSIIIQAGLAIYLLLLGDLGTLLGYFTISYLLQNSLVYGALFSLRKKKEYKPTYRAPLGILLAALSILIQIYIGYGTFMAFPLDGVLVSLTFILSGIPVYLYFYKRKQGNRLTNGE